jgi:hypothetical protein
MTMDDWEKACEFWYGGKLCTCIHVPKKCTCDYVNMCCTDGKLNADKICKDINDLLRIKT